MNLQELFSRRSEPRWLGQEPPPYGYGGYSPRTELRVAMCCPKCEEKVKEEIDEVYGVQEIFTDRARSEVVVYGHADSHEVLKRARKFNKRAAIISSNSFTLHHDKHHKHHKHHRHDKSGHFSDFSHGHSYNGRGKHLPIELAGSPRYNSNLNQSSSYDSRYNRRSGNSAYDLPEFRRRYNQLYKPEQQQFRHLCDGYESEPEIGRYRYGDYRPHLERRSMCDDYRLEHDHRYRYDAYRPSQSYPPSYFEGDFRDSPYPDAILNPDYMKPMDYYYY